MGMLGVAKFREPDPLCSGGAKLREWRLERNLSLIDVAQRLNISLATVGRYEAGYPPPMDIANRIVSLTRGQVRYRDLYWNFHPEYA